MTTAETSSSKSILHVETEVEKAILVGVEWAQNLGDVEASLDELGRLADTAEVQVVGRVTQKLETPNAKTFIGSGKVAEILELARSLDASVIIFDDELTPSQQSNLEKSVDKSMKVIDRTALILDIFALHATSKEGRLQVRLAQNMYLYPRLRGMWAHLASNRMGGGVGSRFGEGESQLEVDRRIVRKRITSIKRELEHLATVRSTQRETRFASGVFKIALAGYTNAGKSSLLNLLTSSDVFSCDKLFATLDSTTRQYRLPEGRQATISDTVGFIQKLPTTLIEAFKSTLVEINGADYILHVIDASSNQLDRQISAVEGILKEIDADGISSLMVFNKIDLLSEDELEELQAFYPEAVFISTLTGEGTPVLVERIIDAAAAHDLTLEVLIPYDKGNMSSLAHDRCRIISEEFTENGTHLVLSAPPEFRKLFDQFRLDKVEGEDEEY